MLTKHKIGDIVYVNGQWNVAEKCQITEICSDSDEKEFYRVQSIDDVGTFGARDDNTFDSKEDAIAAFKNESMRHIAKYKTEIKDLKDLLEFPLNHCFNGEEYADYDAMEAYKIRAKELTGLTLEDE